jgi:hypothetical protein
MAKITKQVEDNAVCDVQQEQMAVEKPASLESQPVYLRKTTVEEWEEYKKDKCVFCFQPGTVHNRRYGRVVLCHSHGFS